MGNKRFPKYPDDVDYNTNSPSYYDDLARKQKLIKLLSERIWEYDDEIKEYFKRWEDNLANINREVIEMMILWLEDGTLDHIINDTIFNWKADKTYVDSEIERLDLKDENLTTQKADKTYVDSEIERLDLKDENLTTQKADKTDLDNLVSIVTDQRNDMDEQASEIETIKNLYNNPNMYNLLPMQSKPSKTGITSNSPKIVYKRDNEFYNIVQKTNKGFLSYDLRRVVGSNGESDTGGSYESYRITKVQTVDTAYLYYDEHKNVVGTLSELHKGSVIPNNSEKILFNLYETVLSESEIYSSKDGNIGLTFYGLTGSGIESSIQYDIFAGKRNKASILMGGTPNSSSEVDILVNDQVVKTVNPNQWSRSSEFTYRLIDFEIPYGDIGSNALINIKIINKDLTKTMYFSCLNLTLLDEYKGERVNQFKVLTEPNYYIDHIGASDYAFMDKNNNKWIGSYHGGETANHVSMVWNKNQNKQFDRENRNGRINPNSEEISKGDFIITNNFMMNQSTTLTTVTGENCVIVSYLDFNTDGTVEALYSIRDNSIVFKNLYTMLSSTHKDLKFITYPDFKSLPDTNSEELIYNSEGIIMQRNEVGSLELVNRYTKFINTYNEKEVSYVLNLPTNYRKLYYGVVVGNEKDFIIPSLSFSRGMDFNRY